MVDLGKNVEESMISCVQGDGVATGPRTDGGQRFQFSRLLGLMEEGKMAVMRPTISQRFQ